MDTNELSQLISDKEKELQVLLKHQERVDDEEIILSKQILELRMKKKDIEQAQSKARHCVRLLQLEIKNLTGKFWLSKQQGT